MQDSKRELQVVDWWRNSLNKGETDYKHKTIRMVMYNYYVMIYVLNSGMEGVFLYNNNSIIVSWYRKKI